MGLKPKFKHSFFRSRYSIKFFASRLVFIFAAIGFMAQAMQVSILYFKFKTRTQVELKSYGAITPHSVAICVRYLDIIDSERLEKESGIKVKAPKTLMDSIDQEDLLTIAQIFEYTPVEADVLSSCFVRTSNWRAGLRTGLECYDVFTVRRFYTLEYMCYAVNETVDQKIGLNFVTQSAFHQHKIYELTLGPKFRKIVKVMPIVFTDGFPVASRTYAPPMPHLKSENESEFKYNIIDVYSSDFLDLKLEPPYDTGCSYGDPLLQSNCKTDCLVSEFAKFKRVPAFELLDVKYDRKVFAVKDLNNSQMVEKATTAYDKCVRKCKTNPCVFGYSKTTARLTTDGTDDVRVSLLTSTDPDITIQAEANMRFIEYFSFVSGCISTWFGLSFLSINSIPFFTRKEKKKNRIGYSMTRTVSPPPFDASRYFKLKY